MDSPCHRKNKGSALLNYIKGIELICICFKLLLRIINRSLLSGMSMKVFQDQDQDQDQDQISLNGFLPARDTKS